MAFANESFEAFNGKLGRRIQSYREAKGLSQEKLANLLGMDRVSVGYIEQGRRSPKLKTLHVLAQNLDCKVIDFFTDLQ